MAVVRPIRTESVEPVGLHTQAMDNLRFIRNAMESAGSFTAVPGQGGMLMGATALFAAFAAHLSASPGAWLRVWIVLAVAPSVFVGAILTFVLYRQGMTQLIPAMWLLLYGAGITSGGAFAVRVVPVMGMSFLALGSLATLTPPRYADAVLALGFGGFHLAVGWVIARRYGG
jgi:hypothetical protein